MTMHSPLSHLFPRSAHQHATRGHTLGAPRFYELFADVFFLGRRRATFASLIAAAGVQPGQRVLDVACGTGYFARLLSRTVGPSGAVIGIDASPEMIHYASRKAARLDNCSFQVGAAESLGFSADSFDVVVSSLAMHHLPDDLQIVALREMRRVLRPGGTLLIADAHMPRSGLPRLATILTGHAHMTRVTPRLQALAELAGFSDVRTGAAPPWLQYVRAVKPDA
jgi:ubiquinone/menaquinone biosynthesis C-methylase UbiE